MRKNINNSLRNNLPEDNNNLKDIFYNYLRHWKWFAIACIISAFLAFIYLRYQTPQYEVNASILIKDDKKGNVISELSAFKDLDILKSGGNIDNEIEVLKSRTLMESVVNELSLNIEYYINKGPIEKELFSDKPIKINCQKFDSCFLNIDTSFVVSILNQTNFKCMTANGEDRGTYRFGDTIKLGSVKINIQPLSTINNFISGEIVVKFFPINKSVDRYKNAIQINAINKTSNVIEITLKDPNKEKAIAIVNNLIMQHKRDAIDDKNQISENTAKFITERIQLITKELSEVETDAETFKTKHQLVDVQSEAGLFLQSGSENEKSLLEAKTQIQIAQYMIDYLKDQSSQNNLLPVNLGITDITIAETINEYNKLILERNKLLKNSGEKNPILVNLASQITNLKQNLFESLTNLKSSLDIKCKDLYKQEQGLNSKIAEVPKYEKEYRVIYRQQQIKEALYLYLLQKREETNIALAVTVANTKIIDKAYSTGVTVSPKRKLVYSAFLLFGILTPIGILYLKELFDTKVRSKIDLENIAVPFLGEVPLTTTKEKLIVTATSNNGISESFRLLRTNVDFMLNGINSKCKTVFITSTIEKEGKSFIALNIASSFALSGKKVLLVGLDLRAPKILEYLDLKNLKGVTNYITKDETEIETLIYKVKNTENLFVMPSGSIPPNPSELLMTERVTELFNDIKQKFDYIIVDTAPIGMVTDTLLVSNYADCFLYIVKANYLEKKMLSIVKNISETKRLPRIGLVINGVEISAINGYGYGYGIYGGEKKKNKLLNVLKLNQIQEN